MAVTKRVSSRIKKKSVANKTTQKLLTKIKHNDLMAKK